MAPQVEKRKRLGKYSEIYINDKLTPNKKISAELSRYVLPIDKEKLQISIKIHSVYIVKRLIICRAPSPEPINGILVRTPVSGSIVTIDYAYIPWLDFLALVEEQCLYYLVMHNIMNNSQYTSVELFRTLAAEKSASPHLSSANRMTILFETQVRFIHVFKNSGLQISP